MEIVNEESFIHITDKRLRIKALSLCVYKNNYLFDFWSFSEYNSNITNSNIRRMYNG